MNLSKRIRDPYEGFDPLQASYWVMICLPEHQMNYGKYGLQTKICLIWERF